MKTRAGFVSNSSSCSFVIRYDDLEGWQTQVADCLYDYIMYWTRENKFGELGWHFKYNHKGGVKQCECDTMMDNEDLPWFMEQLGIPIRDVVSQNKPVYESGREGKKMGKKSVKYAISKDVCKKCHANQEDMQVETDSWNDMDDMMWEKGFVCCQPGRISPTEVMPEWCSYHLEHMVNDGISESVETKG